MTSTHDERMSRGAGRAKVGLAGSAIVIGLLVSTGFAACDQPIQPVGGQAGNVGSGGSGSGGSGSSGTGGSGGSGGGAGGTGGVGQDACRVIAGKTYSSVSPHECGLGGMGVPLICNWQVSFGDGFYQWQYSDLRQSGAYQCLGADVVEGSYRHGTLDFGTGDLTWHGQDYRPQP